MPGPNIQTLTNLTYSDDRRGHLALYLYDSNMRHYGARYIARKITHPDEEVTPKDAKARVDAAIAAGHEVRITNGGDELVFHFASIDRRVAHPADLDQFWREIGAE